MYTVLTQCPLFRGVSEDKIKEMIEGNYSITDYKAGQYIAHRDTAYSGLMIILDGQVCGEMTDSAGRVIPIDAIEAPQLIAPAFLFGGYNKLPIDVIARSDARIMTLHRGYVFEMMQCNTLILSNFIDVISNRANVWSKKIYFLSVKSLKEKVATYLLERTSQTNDSLPQPDISDITECFDATRSAVQTVLAELEKKRLIESDGKRIVIRNRQGLQDILK